MHVCQKESSNMTSGAMDTWRMGRLIVRSDSGRNTSSYDLYAVELSVFYE